MNAIFTWNFSKFNVIFSKTHFWKKKMNKKNFWTKSACQISFKFFTHILWYVYNKSIRGIFNILIKTKNIAENVSPHPIFLLKYLKCDEKNIKILKIKISKFPLTDLFEYNHSISVLIFNVPGVPVSTAMF